MTIILLLGLFFRLSSIELSPPSLNWDEISHGYNAYSILSTGKDEWGKTLPLIFRAYGDFKLPVYIYTTVLSVAIFGINTLAVRLPSILAGTLLIYFTYRLAEHIIIIGRSSLHKDKKTKFNRSIALVAALLVALEPWSLFTSRAAFEANLSQLLIVSGCYFFLTTLQHRQSPDRSDGQASFGSGPTRLVLGIVLLGLSVWTYNSARVFVPLLLFSLIAIYRTELQKIYNKSPSSIHYSVAAVVIFFAPMFIQLVNPSGQARYEWVAIVDEGAVNQIVQDRLNSSYSPLMTRILFNRPVYFVSNFISNYLAHFLPDFLFLRGGSHYQFNIPGFGLLFSIGSPFFYAGLVIIIYRSLVGKSKKIYRALLLWLLLAPIPSALTKESPHTLRAITLLPLPMILTSIGVVEFIEYSVKRFGKGFQILTDIKRSTVPRRKAYYFVYIGSLIIISNTYLYKYFINYREDYSWAWQYGYEQIVDYAKANYDEYEKIIVTKKYGEPHAFFLFYWPWDPQDYQSDQDLIRFEQSNWFWVDRFDKFYFVNDWQVVEDGTDNETFILESGEEAKCDPGSCLLISSPGNAPEGWSRLETVRFLDDEPAFEIYEN